MSVGFGFSAGDFISALQLVSTVLSALQSSSTASSEFCSLISQLHTLESALLRVKRLELHESQYGEVVALRQAAAQCQGTIDAFWEKCRKYQPSLAGSGSESRVRDGWRKVKWAVCKREDVVRFKADLMAHTESIELLLTTVQMAATRISERKNDEVQRSLAGRMQDSYFGCMQRMSVILERVSTGIQQGKQLLEMTAKVIQTNVQIFQIVLNIQRTITRIPGQIEREQPVYFIDALGRHTPFHLEFITSASSLTLVLQNNFRNIGSGATKIEKGEFAIQDSTTKRDVNLDSPWEVCFCPGQKVAMSMVFNSATATNMYCPKCREDNGDEFAEDEDIECKNCGVVYRRSISWNSPQPLPSFSMKTAQVTPKEVDGMDFVNERDEGVARGKRKKPHDEEDEMALFRRIRIKTSIFFLPEDSRPSSPIFVDDSRLDEEASDINLHLRNSSRKYVDVDLQCGVIRRSEPPCPNLLACDVHTLTEKKAVKRSSTFDDVLVDWGVRNARQQAPLRNLSGSRISSKRRIRARERQRFAEAATGDHQTPLSVRSILNKTDKGLSTHFTDGGVGLDGPVLFESIDSDDSDDSHNSNWEGYGDRITDRDLPKSSLNDNPAPPSPMSPRNSDEEMDKALDERHASNDSHLATERWEGISRETIHQAEERAYENARGIKRPLGKDESKLEGSLNDHLAFNASQLDENRRFKSPRISKMKTSHHTQHPGTATPSATLSSTEPSTEEAVFPTDTTITNESIPDVMLDDHIRLLPNATDRSLLDFALQGEMYNRSFWASVKARENAKRKQQVPPSNSFATSWPNPLGFTQNAPSETIVSNPVLGKQRALTREEKDEALAMRANPPSWADFISRNPSVSDNATNSPSSSRPEAEMASRSIAVDEDYDDDFDYHAALEDDANISAADAYALALDEEDVYCREF